jgi:hypothetical protein
VIDDFEELALVRGDVARPAAKEEPDVAGDRGEWRTKLV